MTTANELFAEGKLGDAIAALNDEVRQNPTDHDRRALLAILLCFDGNLDRADLQLNAIVKQDPEAELGIALTRQLLRAEKSRQEFHTAGRVPEFLSAADERAQLHMKASMLLRAGEAAEANERLGQAEELRPACSGTCNGQVVDDFRDGDDLIGGYLEVLTSTGKYYWIPTDRVETATFHAPERSRDLLWRRVSMKVLGGPDGDVYLPAVYAPVDAESSEAARLGRETEWVGGDDAPTRGRGLRTFLAGDEALNLHQLEEMTFAASGEGAPG